MPLPPPGPIETGLLAELSPALSSRTVDVGLCSLRVLEGGEGPTLVLLHGRGHAASIWFPLLPLLLKRFRVLAVDLPGFGQSTTPTQGKDALSFFADPVEKLLASEGPLSIAGHSLGGFVGLELALRKKVDVQKLVLIDAMGLSPELSFAARAWFNAGPERMARLLGRNTTAKLLKQKPGALSSLEYELLAIEGGRNEATRAFTALSPLFATPPHRFEALADVPCPSLLLWGERDDVFGPKVAHEAAARLKNARVHVTPHGHSPHLEDPAGAVAVMESFLAS